MKYHALFVISKNTATFGIDVFGALRVKAFERFHLQIPHNLV